MHFRYFSALLKLPYIIIIQLVIFFVHFPKVKGTAVAKGFNASTEIVLLLLSKVKKAKLVSRVKKALQMEFTSITNK